MSDEDDGMELRVGCNVLVLLIAVLLWVAIIGIVCVAIWMWP